MTKGIGYQEVRDRLKKSGIKAGNIEKPGNERYVIYFGRAHVRDHETGVLSRGYMKIGRGKFISSLMRNRNQPGVDFRVYGELVFRRESDIIEVEKMIARAFVHKNINGDQGQQELYNITDLELPAVMKEIIYLIDLKGYIKIKEAMLYNLTNSVGEITTVLIKDNKAETKNLFDEFFRQDN